MRRKQERERDIYIKYIITYKINLDNDNGVEVSVGREMLDLLSTREL